MRDKEYYREWNELELRKMMREEIIKFIKFVKDNKNELS